MTPEGSATRPGPVQQLVAASQELMVDALHAYVDDRQLKVATTAPVAVEQLAKALLWKINPALLVMLDRNHEESLRLLTSATPSLEHPKLRTIGLDSALKRVPDEVTQTVSREKRQEMISARNGAVHVGQGQDAIEIMTTALNMADNLLRAHDIDTSDSYLSHTETVANLLTEGRSLVQRRVDNPAVLASAQTERTCSHTSNEGLQRSPSRCNEYRTGCCLPELSYNVRRHIRARSRQEASEGPMSR